MIHQLDPPLPLQTPKGSGLAHILIDYGPEFDLHWTVFLDENGECWTFRNREVRACRNITLGRTHPDRPAPSKDDVAPLIGSTTKRNGVAHSGVFEKTD